MADITRPLMLDSTGQQIANAIQDTMLAVPIVDNLNTADPSKALSANQGKILNDERVRHTSDVAAGAVPINADQLNGHPDTYFARKWDLLWTNSSPGSAFAAQTISVDYSGYDFICIFCSINTSSSQAIQSTALALNAKGKIYMGIADDTSTNMYKRTASLSADSSSIEFSTGYIGTTANTSVCIPCYIYGIKL